MKGTKQPPPLFVGFFIVNTFRIRAQAPAIWGLCPGCLKKASERDSARAFRGARSWLDPKRKLISPRKTAVPAISASAWAGRLLQTPQSHRDSFHRQNSPRGRGMSPKCREESPMSAPGSGGNPHPGHRNPKAQSGRLTLPRRRRFASADTGRRRDSSDPHWLHASHLWHK